MQQYTKKLPLQQKQKYFISMAEVFFTVSEKTYQKNIFPLLLRQVMKLFLLIIPLLQQQILNKLFQIYVIQHSGLFPQ